MSGASTNRLLANAAAPARLPEGAVVTAPGDVGWTNGRNRFPAACWQTFNPIMHG